jgi:SpoVK/Ycf46/Vps4 family AAA+-type ATPase
VFGSFMTWLQEKKAPVFVVATANDVRSLPPELLRRGRFDEIFFLDLPDPGARADILGVHLSPAWAPDGGLRPRRAQPT